MTNKELTLAQLMRAMIKYDGGDAPRIQHFVKVHDFARMIAIAEGMNRRRPLRARSSSHSSRCRHSRFRSQIRQLRWQAPGRTGS